MHGYKWPINCTRTRPARGRGSGELEQLASVLGNLLQIEDMVPPSTPRVSTPTSKAGTTTALLLASSNGGGATAATAGAQLPLSSNPKLTRQNVRREQRQKAPRLRGFEQEGEEGEEVGAEGQADQRLDQESPAHSSSSSSSSSRRGHRIRFEPAYLNPVRTGLPPSLSLSLCVCLCVSLSIRCTLLMVL